jgi:hypothetical protein
VHHTKVGIRRWFALTALAAVTVVTTNVTVLGSHVPASATVSKGTGRHPVAAVHVASLAKNAKWARVVDSVPASGEVSLATALSAFAVAIGRVPGAVAPKGIVAPIESGTIAVDWVLSHWSQLTASQQAAVLGDLGQPKSSAVATKADATPEVGDSVLSDTLAGSSTPNPNAACPNSDSAGAARYREQVLPIEQDIAADTGVGYPDPIYLEVNTSNVAVDPGDDDSLMYTYGCTGGQPTTGSAATVDACVIHIQPRISGGGIGAYSSQDIHADLIHELTHCLLFEHFGGATYSFPTWYGEGIPMWVQAELGGGDSTSENYWQMYLVSPGIALFTRTYTGLGFFVHLNETGTDVWHAIVPIGAAFVASGNSNIAGWNAAAPTSKFLDTWGSGYAQGRYPGSAWSSIGPGLSEYRAPLAPADQVQNDIPVVVQSNATATNIQPVNIDAQVVQVGSSSGAAGRVSLGHGEDVTVANAAGVNYCSESTPCSCPTGSSNSDATFTPIVSGLQYATVTGGTSAATVTLTGESLKEFCSDASCIVGSFTVTDETSSTLGLVGGAAGATWTVKADGTWAIDWNGSAPLESQDGSTVTYTGTQGGTTQLPKDPKATSATLVFNNLSGDAVAHNSDGTSENLPVAGSTTDAFSCQGDTVTVDVPDGIGDTLVTTLHRTGS